MKKVVDRASSRGYFDHGWLKTYHTFSFADYYNPTRVHFGALRVLNDDWVAPSQGFGAHPHKNMEVVSIPLKGKLRHGDSVANTRTITPGDVQVMSTGSGILHSEYNGSDKEPVEFLQIWVFPDRENTPPEYNNYNIRGLLKKMNWLCLYHQTVALQPLFCRMHGFLWENSMQERLLIIKYMIKIWVFIFLLLRGKSRLQKRFFRKETASEFGMFLI